MKIIRLIMVFAVSSLLFFTACDSTDPSDDSKETEVKTTLAQLDATMGGMADLQASPMLAALDEMPEGLMDLGFILPQLITTVTPDNLSKNAANGRIFETLADTTISDILDMLLELYGTHTYINDQWVSTDTPSDAIVMMYPFVDVNTGSSHDARVEIKSISLDQTVMSGTLEVYIDNVKQLWIDLNVVGSNLFEETAVPISLGVSGGMLADNGLTISFGLTVTDTNLEVQLGVAGISSLTLTVTADDLFNSMLGDTGEFMPNSVALSYGEVELIVNNFEVSNVGDDMGDVNYGGSKVGDIIIEEAGLFIVFNNGNKVNIEDLLPNSMALLAGLPI